MSQFYASIQGARGAVSRTGSKLSGLSGHLRGWHIGAYVECHHVNGEDRVFINLTHGSTNPGSTQCLGEFRLASDGTFEKVL